MLSMFHGSTRGDLRAVATFASRPWAARARQRARATSPLGGASGVRGFTGRLARPAQSGRSCIGEGRR